MTPLLLVLLPALGGVLALFVPRDDWRRGALVAVAAVHALLVVTAWRQPLATPERGLVGLDPLGLLVLTVASLLFLCTAVYAAGYLAREGSGRHRDFEEGVWFTNTREAVFTACLLWFLATMSLVCVSQDFGLLWVGIEATTLASAPLISYHRHHRSVEATWKYLVVCSVGIALALLGTFFLAVAGTVSGGGGSVGLASLLGRAPHLNGPWLRAAFLFLVVGYGTKAGLAPLHTWLPDAHSEAPSTVSALLSGALLNCAFLGILRAQQVCVAAGQGAFGGDVLLVFGFVSMGAAAVFLLGQRDFKRLLAYSSVEHMGIIAVGIGLGGIGTGGALLHAVNHSFTKGMLFLVAGSLLAAYKTKDTRVIRGALGRLPVSGVLWVAGFLAITGTPPFGTFVSEFTVLTAAIRQHHPLLGALYLALLAVAFIAMASVMLRMAHGTPGDGLAAPRPESALAILPPLALGVGSLLLGVAIPAPLAALLHRAAEQLGGI